jgi:hypothetical protein
VLAAEILTRVWTACSAAWDRQRDTAEAEPVARSIWVGHLEARGRALKLLAAGPGLKTAEAGELDRFRRANQRWTDFLLAPFARLCNVDNLAHNVERLHDFAEDWGDDKPSAGSPQAREIWTASLRATFASRGQYPTFNADLNARIAGGIMVCLGLDPGEGAGSLCPSLWLARLVTTTTDAEAMIESLLSGEAAS